MNTLLSSIIIGFSLLFSTSNEFNKIEIAKTLYQAKNERDTAIVEQILHDDFSMIDDDGSMDWDKQKWIEKMWCKSCHKDTIEVISIEEKEDAVYIVTAHKSEVLRLLEIPYFKDLDKVYFQDNKIVKIVRDTMPGYAAQSKLADQKYARFSLWLYHHYPEANIDDPSILPLVEEYTHKKYKRKICRKLFHKH